MDPIDINKAYENTQTFNQNEPEILLMLGTSNYPSIDQIKLSAISTASNFQQWSSEEINSLEFSSFFYNYPFAFSTLPKVTAYEFSFIKPEWSHLRFTQPNIHLAGI